MIVENLPTKEIVAHKKIEKETQDFLPILTKLSFPNLISLKLGKNTITKFSSRFVVFRAFIN